MHGCRAGRTRAEVIGPPRLKDLGDSIEGLCSIKTVSRPEIAGNCRQSGSCPLASRTPFAATDRSASPRHTHRQTQHVRRPRPSVGRTRPRIVGHTRSPRDKIAPADPGTQLEDKIVEHLKVLRPKLHIERGRSAREFSQYAHLDVFPNFESTFEDLRPTVADLSERIRAADLGRARIRIERDLDTLITSVDQQAALVGDLVEQMPAESLLKIDVSVAIPHKGGLDELAIALSSKWSLRTDRAQDCVSQGNKLVAQRRGRMPHFGVITIEPRPAMLRILADGSGAVDFVYHLDPRRSPTQLTCGGAKGGLAGHRANLQPPHEAEALRGFDELVHEVMRVPAK